MYIMSVSKKITPTSLILVLIVIGTWTAYWSLERMYLYTHSTPDAMVNFTLRNYIPSDAPEEWKQAFSEAMSQMYSVDREFFSRVVHVQLSGLIAFCCLINLYLGDDVAALSTTERVTSRKAAIHRFTGRMFQSSVIPWSLYLNYVLFVHGMINFVSNILFICIDIFVWQNALFPSLYLSSQYYTIHYGRGQLWRESTRLHQSYPQLHLARASASLSTAKISQHTNSA